MQDFTMGAISAQDIVDTLRDGLLVLTSDLTVISANRAFYAMFKVSEPETVGRKLNDLGNRQWNIDALKRLLEDILPTENSVEGFEVDHVFTGLGRKVMLLNARKVVCSGDSSHFLLLAIDDVTEARVSQIEAERNLRIAQNIVDTIRDPLVILESDMSVVTASRSFLALFNATASQVVGRSPRSGTVGYLCPAQIIGACGSSRRSNGRLPARRRFSRNWSPYLQSERPQGISSRQS
ncbi:MULTISPECIES: PAS domain-containing protein [unclassified Rhizobium]|uniref:PAS domain-containing protein n=1 Tax=unclassified Rhizobium TaxID=2613769 RepID=UPI001FFE1F5F|nr:MULTISPECIES: PAS domain-containing protein [unclassified Rhizobium]